MILYLVFNNCVLAVYGKIFVNLCPNDSIVPSYFDLNAFTGLWYQYARFGYENDGPNKMDCFMIDVKQIEAKALGLDIAYEQIPVHLRLMKERGILHIGNGSELNERWRLEIKNHSRAFSNRYPEHHISDVKIVAFDTDYTAYAVLYWCRNLQYLNFNRYSDQFVWVLTRSRLIPDPSTFRNYAKSQIDTIIHRTGFNLNTFHLTRQTDCSPDTVPKLKHRKLKNIFNKSMILVSAKAAIARRRLKKAQRANSSMQVVCSNNSTA